MKKTILAIAIPALFASAANAATVYDKDGTSFDVYGRVQADYFGEHDKTDAELQGHARLGLKGKVALNNTWSAIAKAEWQVAAENSDKNTFNTTTQKVEKDDGRFEARHVYAGFDGAQYGQILFGQTDTAYYTGLIEKTDIFNEWGNEANGYGSRQEGQIIYMGKWDGFFTNLSYQTNDDNAVMQDIGSGSLGKQLDKGYAASVGYDFSFGLGLAAGYAKNDYKNNYEKEDWALAASYAINGFYFAGLYNESQVTGLASEEINYRGYELAASYNVDAWTFLTGYNFSEIDSVTASTVVPKDVADYTYLGVQYAFTPKLKAYTEYRIDGLKDSDDQWTVALQYNF